MNDISMMVGEIEKFILREKLGKKRIFATSSFQTQSIVLLHILSNFDKNLPIYFINTGYHFPQTLKYKDQITKLLHLNVIDIFPVISKSQQRNSNGCLLYTSDPDRCCYYNKVLPLERVLTKYDIWISGIRGDQTKIRKNMKKTMQGAHGIIRYHPLLDWTQEMIEQYLKTHDLPLHPLALASGNLRLSIGCEPCTKLGNNLSNEKLRTERWIGLKKTECGLHTELGAVQ